MVSAAGVEWRRRVRRCVAVTVRAVYVARWAVAVLYVRSRRIHFVAERLILLSRSG